MVSWPGWLTYSGRFTHISGYPSTAGRAQDRESSPAKDRRCHATNRSRPEAVVSKLGDDQSRYVLQNDGPHRRILFVVKLKIQRTRLHFGLRWTRECV